MPGLTRLRPYLSARYLALAAALVILAAALGVAYLVLRPDISPAAIRAALAGLGLLGPLALIAALAAVLVVPVIPASVLQIGAGLAFGPWFGLLYATLADILGASIGFWLGRRGRSFLEARLSPEMHARLIALTRRMSWTHVVLLRLIPGPAYPLVSLAAGHSRLSYPAFITASLGGVLPALVLLVLAGDLVSSSPLVAFALVLLIVVSLAVAGRLLGGERELDADERG